jgi:hypothetical protein
MKRTLPLVLAGVGALAAAVAATQWLRGASRPVDTAAPAPPSPARADPSEVPPPGVDEDVDRRPAQDSRQGGSGHRLRLVDGSGQPVVGAEVWLAGAALPWRSDAQGGVTLPDASFSGLVLAQGYLPIKVHDRSPERTIRLERDHGLRLLVRWEDGEPIRGARVSAGFAESRLDSALLARLEASSESTDDAGTCLVRGHRLGFLPATLRIEPPGAAPAWVSLPRELDVTSGEARHEVRLPRGHAGHHVRVVDAQGRALADRAVTLYRGPRETVHTDPDGRATFTARLGEARVRGSDVTGYAVELEAGRAWWYVERKGPPASGAEVEFVVAPIEVRGRVLTAAPNSYVVATFAQVELDVGWRRWPQRSEVGVTWVDLDPDGTFGPLPGVQGAQTQVVVRHRDHDTILDQALVPAGGGPVELEVPDVCRVSVVVNGEARSDARLSWETPWPSHELNGRASISVRTFGGPSFESGVPSGGGEIEIPRNLYRVTLSVADTWVGSHEVDATGPTATLTLDLPRTVRVDVRIISSLRGPIAGLPVDLRSGSGMGSRNGRTDADGRLVLEFPARGPISVMPQWGEDRIRMDGWQGLDPELDPEHPTAHYVIEEALLRVVEMPPSPLLRKAKLRLERKRTDGVRATSSAAAPLARLLTQGMLVAPGNYTLTRRFDARRIQSVEVTLAANEERELVLDNSGLAALYLHVTVADPARSELRLRARSSDGSIAAIDGERRPGDDPWEFLKVVEPGLYQLEVESRARGAALTEPPRDVWRGEFRAVPGASAPLRIHLR